MPLRRTPGPTILKTPRRSQGTPLSQRARSRRGGTPPDVRDVAARVFLIGGAAGLLGIFGWRWMSDETKYNLLRSTLELNEKVSEFLYRPSRLAPEFPASAISPRRVNGMIGDRFRLEAESWRLAVRGYSRARPRT